MSDLAGQVALVTGAACPPGIGRAVALDLAGRGAQVVCVERIVEPGPDGALPDSACATATALDETVGAANALPGEAVGFPADASEPGDAEAAVAHALERFGRLDLCVNVEGGLGATLGHGALLDIDRTGWDRCLAVNLTAAWAVAVAAARPMVTAGSGAIVLLSSYAAGGAPRPGVGAFAVAKAGVDRLVRELADELGPHGVRVNGVRPLGVDPERALGRNPFLEGVVASSGPTGSDWPADNIALGRFQGADETAAVVAFLASDRASFVNGEVVNVTGSARF